MFIYNSLFSICFFLDKFTILFLVPAAQTSNNQAISRRENTFKIYAILLCKNLAYFTPCLSPGVTNVTHSDHQYRQDTRTKCLSFSVDRKTQIKKSIFKNKHFTTAAELLYRLERLLLIWWRSQRRRKINTPIVQKYCLSPCLCEKMYFTRLCHILTSYSPVVHTGYTKTKKIWYLPLQSHIWTTGFPYSVKQDVLFIPTPPSLFQMWFKSYTKLKQN